MGMLFQGWGRERPAPAVRKTFAGLQAMTPAARAEALSSGDGEAAGWIAAAAGYGIVEAQVMLGQMLLDGTGTGRDPALALRWFAAAASAGYPPALNMEGRCHDMGWGTVRDSTRAAELFRQAADAGLDWGQYNLACLLVRGRGVPRDRPAAMTLFLQAVEQGHVKSMNWMGRFHEHGWDIPRDLDAAADWYRRAAEGGDFRGQFNHGSVLAQRGQREEAVLWLTRAVAGGTPEFLAEAGAMLVASEDPAFPPIGWLAQDRLARMRAGCTAASDG